MSTPTQSPTPWVRRRGVKLADTLLLVAVAALVVRCRSESAPAAHSAAAAASGQADTWMNRWHKEAFDGQDARKLWDQFSLAARAELNKPGADPSDLSAQANALGADPENVFQFVRDQITLEPYAGVLRGARGTLAAGAGNALDRALLAKDLLRLDGIESRLVTGRLSDAQADTLLARFFSSSQVPRILADLIATPNEAAMKAHAEQFAATFGIPEQAAASLADHMRDEAQGFWATTDAQSSMQFDSLDSHLRRTSLKMAVDAGLLTAKLKDRLRQHFWLQVKEPHGVWSEFDPAFGDSHRGTAHGSRPVALSDPPDSLYHRLTFTLLYETTTDGATKEDTVVAGTYASADALFQSLEFRIQPTDVGTDAKALLAMNAKTKVETLRNLKRFQGLLVTAGKINAGRKFDFEGNTYDPTSGPSLTPAAGTFADALGGSESAVQFVELRVDMRLTGPGREPMTQSRSLVRGPDLASPTFVPPMLEWEILLQPQWIPAEFVAFHALDQALGLGDAVASASKGGKPLYNIRRPTSASPIVLQMSVLRQTATARILASRNGVRAFIDEPMLTISGHRLAALDDKEGTITGSRSFDIVENGVRYVPIDDAAADIAFNAALRQGVADCTLEDRILRENFPRTATKSGMTIIEQANAEKRPVLLAKTQDIDALRSTGVTETDINWIHDNELPDSRLVVATTASGSDAWWSVRPNGTAVLRTNGGGGQGTTEHAITLTDAVMTFLCGWEVGTAINQYRNSGEVEVLTGVGIMGCVSIGLGSKVAFLALRKPGIVLEGAAVAGDIIYKLTIMWGEMMQATGGIREDELPPAGQNGWNTSGGGGQP